MAPAPVGLARLGSGIVSRERRRSVSLLVALTALVWRAPGVISIVHSHASELRAALEAAVPVPFTSNGFGLGPFITSREFPWVGSPLYTLAVATASTLRSHGILLLVLQAVLAALVAVAVFRVGERWLGYRTGVLASLLWCVCRLAVASTFSIGPAMAVTLGSLLVAAALSRVHTRSEAREALRLGMGQGTLALLSGLGALWAAITTVWLPTRGKAFRGLRLLAAVGYLLAGGAAVLSPALLRNAMTRVDFILPFSNAAFDLYSGITSSEVEPPADLAHSPDPVVRHQYASLLAVRLRPDRPGSELGAAGVWLGRSAATLARHPGAVVSVWARRALAFLGGARSPSRAGWLLGETRPPGLPTLPLGAVSAVLWLGGFALLGSFRAYLPLYAAAGLPMVCAAMTGATAPWQLIALPGQVMLAAYGVVRVLEAKRSWTTWVAAVPLLALGTAVVLLF